MKIFRFGLSMAHRHTWLLKRVPIAAIICIAIMELMWLLHRDGNLSKTYPNAESCHTSYGTHDERISDFMPTKDSIFFIESSGKKSIKGRNLCAIESAALHNPNSTIYVVMTARNINQGLTLSNLLLNYNNIVIRTLDMRSFFQGTKLEHLYTSKKMFASQFNTSHLSDVLRFSLLWRFGGTYLDTDMISLRALPRSSITPNFVAQEVKNIFNCAVVRFQFGHRMLDYLQDYLASKFDGSNWGANGPMAITRTIYHFCNTTMFPSLADVTDVTTPGCHNLTAFPSQYFYPGRYDSARLLFSDANKGLNDKNDKKKMLKLANQSYTVHLWSTARTWAKYPKVLDNKADTAFKTIAFKNCPISVQMLMSKPEGF